MPRTAKKGGREQAAGPTGPDMLMRALAEMEDAASLTEDELRRIIEDSLVSAYRRNVNDDPTVTATLLPDGSYELSRRTPSGPELIPQLNDQIVRYAARTMRLVFEEQKLLKVSSALLQDLLSRKGEMIDATLEGKDGDTWLLKTKDFMAMLPSHEQVPGEVLHHHAHTRVVIIGVHRFSGGGIVAITSRSHPQLVRRLLEQEIPEIATGQIVIAAVSREAGRRSKVAVHATDPVIDAQGACIGPKGVRHRSVVEQLGGEHVHIVTWSEDPAELIGNALAPAEVISVTLDEEAHSALALVPDGQLSLAIGKGGENARLVAKLTGWKIDIRGLDSQGETPA